MRCPATPLLNAGALGFDRRANNPELPSPITAPQKTEQTNRKIPSSEYLFHFSVKTSTLFCSRADGTGDRRAIGNFWPKKAVKADDRAYMWAAHPDGTDIPSTLE
ncbi:hypothetical protein NXC24_CH03954 [Rhizobium sp. NXC24]|nr:hypothetical protein NXC24_CH03954 [Rhizobium sp. NXC24]